MRQLPGRVPSKPGAAANTAIPDLDDHHDTSVATELLWAWRHVLSNKRRTQGMLVFAFMLVGGFAELLTLGAVVPLLAIFASSGASQSSSSISVLMARAGLDLTHYSLSTIAILFCTIAVGTAIVRILLSWVTQRYVFGVRYDVGVALYDRMLRQPYSFHVGVHSSRIIACLENVPRLASGMLLPLFQACIAIIIANFVLAGLIALNPFASLVAMLGFSLIYGGLSLTAGRGLRRNAQIIARMTRLRFQTVQEGLGGIGDVILDNAQPIYVRKFAKLDDRMRNAQGINALVATTPRYAAEATGIILMVVLAVILHRQQGGAAASLPILGALALGAQRLLPLMQQTYFGWASILSNRSMFFDTMILLRQPLPAKVSTEPVPPFHSILQLDSIDFAYSANQPLTLHNISLQIPKGSRVGFVGKSGSGKTTLLNLVMGLLAPTAGEIRVDGRVLTETNKHSWQRQVARVPQSIFLTDGSIAENVAFGLSASEIDQQKLRQVCRQADVAEFIEGLPNGYSTPVGERGIRLSGGQIQRIGLARALYKDATVLILDEATSALDDSTEANIIEAVRRLGDRYTVLIIAHRTNTLRDCDLIFRLDSGRLAQGDSAVLKSGSTISVGQSKDSAPKLRAGSRSAHRE